MIKSFTDWEFKNTLNDNINFLYSDPFKVTKFDNGQNWLIETKNDEIAIQQVSVPSIDSTHYDIDVDFDDHTYSMRDQRVRYHINNDDFKDMPQSKTTDYRKILKPRKYFYIGYVSPTYNCMIHQETPENQTRAIIYLYYRNDVKYDGNLYIFINNRLVKDMKVGGFIEPFESKFEVDLESDPIIVIKTTSEDNKPICGEVRLEIFIF